MRKNIFIKSMLAKPVRTLLLILLIAAASFTFALRAVEYVVVREQISEMARFFQSIGVLTHRDGITADISQAIQVIAESPYVEFYDKRRGFEGTLADMYNAYIEGSRYWQASLMYNHFREQYFAREYINLMPRLRPVSGFAGFVSGDSFFYGELLYIEVVNAPSWMDAALGLYPHKLLHVKVDYVLQGYPEMIAEGRTVILRKDFPAGGTVISPFTDMEIGQRYFFKGTFYWGLGGLPFDRVNIMMYIRQIGHWGLWYIPVECGESVDVAAFRMRSQLDFARHAQSAVYLRTSKDMAHLPYFQAGQGILSLREGRLITMDDYVNVRPVIVIHRHFAERRGVGIGDTLRVSVNAEQHLVYAPYYIISVTDEDMRNRPVLFFTELGVLSRPGGAPSITLELEVVGIFDMFHWRPININWSSANKFMFIPDSLLPSDWGLGSAHFGDIPNDYAPALWFSFVLDDPRNAAAFLWDTRDELAYLGFHASFIGADGGGFLPVPDVSLMSVALSLIIFLVVVAFIVVLYMWQRRGDYAILRALGCPARNVYMHSTFALMLFGVPGCIAGCVTGWFYAVNMTTDATAAGFGESIAADMDIHLLANERLALATSYMGMFIMLVFMVLLLLSVILVVHLFQKLVQSYVVEKEQVALQTQMQLLQNQIHDVNGMYTEVKGMRHDLKSHLSNIRLLIKSASKGNHERELDEYIGKFEDTLNAFDFVYQTGNSISDIIIHQKYIECNNHGIDFTADFVYPSQLNIDVYDIAVTLNNGLENAIEACIKMDNKIDCGCETDGRREAGGRDADGGCETDCECEAVGGCEADCRCEAVDRYIKLYAYVKGQMFFIEIENSFNGEIIKFSSDTGLPKSSKADSGLHGMGVANIKRSANKYFGDISLEIVQNDDCKIFRIVAMLQGRS